MNRTLVIFIVTLVAAAVGFTLIKRQFKEDEPVVEVSNFEECVAAGNAIMESWPRQCRTEDGQTFVEDIGNELEKTDLITIDNPRPNQVIASPLLIEGQARGTWFFEGDFPLKLLDEQGEIIVEHYATAQCGWMTEEFVPFNAEIEFNTTSTKGALLLIKDNPSGLPENDDQLIVPVKFAVD